MIGKAEIVEVLSGGNVLHSGLLCNLLKEQESNDVTHVIIKETFCLYISFSVLRVIHFKMKSSVVLFENVASIVSVHNSSNQYIIVSIDGCLITVILDGEFVIREVASIALNTVLSVYGNINTSVTSTFHPHGSFLTCNSQSTGFVVIHVDMSDLNVLNVFKMIQVLPNDNLPVLSTFWGLTSRQFVVTCGHGTTLDVWNISNQDNISNGMINVDHNVEPTPSLVSTNHRGHLTALSTSVGTTCDLGASGDCLGTLCLWMCSSNSSDGAKCTPSDPIQLLLTDRTITSGHSIGAILIDSEASLMWVADCSGTVSCVLINLSGPKPSLEPNTRVNVFHGSSSTGPSILTWRPHSDADTQQHTASDNRSSGTLRCFCPHSGMLVECNVPRNAVSVFRAWPEYPCVDEQTSLVECCQVVSNMHCTVTAGAGRHVYVHDINTGHLVHTIKTDDSLCRSLAVHESSSWSSTTISTALIATGHSNGSVSIFKLSVNVDAERNRQPGSGRDVLERNLNHSEEDLNQSAGPESVELLDILGAEAEEFGSQRNLEGSNATDKSRDLQFSSQESEFRDTVEDVIEDRYQQQYQLQQQHAPLYSHSVVCSSKFFSPLPVTDLFLSTHGGFLVVCFLRRFICVYSILLEKVIKTLSLEVGILHVAVVAATEETSSSGEQDSLILSVQTAHKIMLLDAVQCVVLTEFDLHTNHKAVARSGLWDQPLNNRSGDRSIAGICVTNDFGVFLFGDLTGFVQYPLTHPTTSAKSSSKRSSKKPSESQSAAQLDGLVQGLQVHAAGHSPLATIWSLRRLVVLRVTLDNYKPEVMRSVQLRVGNSKVRVVHAVALKAQPNVRAHRVLVMLSDGTAYILNV